MKLHITYCSKNKTSHSEKIEAVKRYNSTRINEIRKLAENEGDDFAILSGKYGLIPAEKPIPQYDKLLEKKDISKLLPETRNYLKAVDPQKVVYHTKKVEGVRKPYFQLIKDACIAEDIEFEKRVINRYT